MSRAFPLAGSVYTYAQRGLHEIAGFFSGWLILLDYILVPALLYLISAVALRPDFSRRARLDMAGRIHFLQWLSSICSALSSRHGSTGTCWSMELATLGLFVVLGLIALYGGGGAGRLTLQPIYDPQVFSAATVAGATSIAVLSFLGFDGISTLAEESRGNQCAVGRATVLSLALIGALFMLQTWIATDLARGMHFASSDTAFYEVAQRAGGPPLRLITILATVIASGDRQCHGRTSGGVAHPVRHGPRRKTARDAGQSASSLPDAVREHAGGRRRVAAGGFVLCRSPG